MKKILFIAGILLLSPAFEAASYAASCWDAVKTALARACCCSTRRQRSVAAVAMPTSAPVVSGDSSVEKAIEDLEYSMPQAACSVLGFTAYGDLKPASVQAIAEQLPLVDRSGFSEKMHELFNLFSSFILTQVKSNEIPAIGSARTPRSAAIEASRRIADASASPGSGRGRSAGRAPSRYPTS